MIEMAEGISSLGYDCEFIGGMTKLTELCNNKPDVSNTILLIIIMAILVNLNEVKVLYY